MSDDQDRTEQPTPRRRAQARSEGRLPSSAAASAWLVLVLSAIVATTAAGAIAPWMEFWRATATHAATLAEHRATREMIAMGASALVWRPGWLIVLVAACTTLAASAGASALGGALAFAPAALKPRLERLSWNTGVRQLFNPESAKHATVALVAPALVVLCSVPAAQALERIAAAGLAPNGTAFAVVAAARDLWWVLALALAGPTCLDIWLTRQRSVRSLRMTPREVRDERVEAEGKPELRARRRAQASTPRGVRLGAIRKATAVVVNPTHVAVALRYAPPRLDVPVVVSRGADLAASLVRVIAAAHDVPIIESPELARTLYSRVTLGEPIPEDCFEAVAAIFAWLLGTRGTLQGSDDE